MALSLKDKESDRLAREVASLTGETLTDTIGKGPGRTTGARTPAAGPDRQPDRATDGAEPGTCATAGRRSPDPERDRGIRRHRSPGPMAIDTSAVVAILFDQADRFSYAATIDAASVRFTSAVTRIGLSLVVEGPKREAGRDGLDRFSALTGMKVVSVTPEQARLATVASRKFGKGMLPAGLDIGDRFPYALASATGRPLLFKGNESSRTDIKSAVARPGVS
ncbi:PIN domain-containing protein [Lichenicoccus roseus]|uniref:PIN domain-containing protein n=1 Tax=Lichenicoccus roseus TaxID=2683649 RepID=A0A5R9J567_9PROT|nr:PIN domain-containing protein [Lichenicoccus roseus]